MLDFGLGKTLDSEPGTQDSNNSPTMTLAATQALGLVTFLASDERDARLAEAVALKEATPSKLAAFAARSTSQRALVEELLGDRELLVEMAVADGPNGRSDRGAVVHAQMAAPLVQQRVKERLAAQGVAL